MCLWKGKEKKIGNTGVTVDLLQCSCWMAVEFYFPSLLFVLYLMPHKDQTIIALESGFQLSVESNCVFALVLHYWVITALCDWLIKLAPLSQPIRCKTKTNRVFTTRVFPRFAPITCICFEFWLVHCALHLLRLARVITLVLVLRHSIENCSK